jgi:uncharacterized protein
MNNQNNTKFDRYLQKQLEDRLFKGDIIVIYGPRQVGKTTLVKALAEKYSDAKYILCDTPENSEFWSRPSLVDLQRYIGSTRILILDEAQSVENIGLTLKNIFDNFPDLQVIATGSSSFELSNKIKEALTGRKWELFMYPISMSELLRTHDFTEVKSFIPELLRVGMYPKILTSAQDDIEQRLDFLTSDYLFKDVLKFEKVQSSRVLKDLLIALALQLGKEVSFRELGELVGINKQTVERYIDLLQKAFIIFPLFPLSRNQRNEINKTRKIYFYDLGIRNSLIKNLNKINLRNDIGALWENFCIIERQKANAKNSIRVNSYFWRNYQQAEIDYIEEKDGQYHPFEIKWKKTNVKLPKGFADSYDFTDFKVITPESIWDFIE